MMATSIPQDILPHSSPPIHRRAKSFDPQTLAQDQLQGHTHEEANSIPMIPTHHADSRLRTTTTTTQPARVGRSLSLFRRPSRHQGQVFTQGTVPPMPQVPILQHSGKTASRLLRLDDAILVRIARNLSFDQLMDFAHLAKRCRAIAAKTLTLTLQQTVLKATLCQERKAVFSLEFIFQHLDPASLHAVFRASQLKSRRYFENSALARPVVQALTLVTPNGAHHPVFSLAGFDQGHGSEPMADRDLDRATTLLSRPFQLDIKDKGYYRVSPATTCMVDTPFFPSQPLLDPLVPIAMDTTAQGPTWEMMYKVDLQPPNYPMKVQQQQQKIQQERTRQVTVDGQNPPRTTPTAGSGQQSHVASGLPPATGFVPLPAIKSGPNLRSLLPEPSPLSGSGEKSKLKRKPTVVRPPPEGWGPLPPVAPPPPVPAALAYQLGARTVNPDNGTPISPTQTSAPKSPVVAGATVSGHANYASEPSCLEPELAEETERFLSLLFIQFPIQTLFPVMANAQHKKSGGIMSGWMNKSKLGRTLTQKKNARTSEDGTF